MKTIIIGGGHGCREILTLSRQGFIKELDLETLAVIDIDNEAPGMVYARELGIPTYNSWENAAAEIEYELIIELTGNDELLEDIYKRLPLGIRLIDHKMAHIFWDLINAQRDKEKQIKEVLNLEEKLLKEKRFLQDVFDGLNDLAVVIETPEDDIGQEEHPTSVVDQPAKFDPVPAGNEEPTKIEDPLSPAPQLAVVDQGPDQDSVPDLSEGSESSYELDLWVAPEDDDLPPPPDELASVYAKEGIEIPFRASKM